MIYDVIIIGGGIGGLMSAYQLKTKNKDLSIAILEKGSQIEDRKCPAAINKQPCYHCKKCSITEGYAGAGAFSDGKFTIGISYGGTLSSEIGNDQTLKYIKDVDNILMTFSDGKFPEAYPIESDLISKCTKAGLHMLPMNVRHLGTDNNYRIMFNLIQNLKNIGVDTYCNVEVLDIIRDPGSDADSKDNFLYFLKTSIPEVFSAKNIIISTGRNGQDFVKTICSKYNIGYSSNLVDLGVRVEMPDCIWSEFSSKIYEPKIHIKTKTFEDNTRMFCFNQGGSVSSEVNDGVVTANGHSYADPLKKTENCNFAILSSIQFTEPFNQPTEYVKNIAELANKIGNGNIIVQRFGDLIRGRRTTESRLAQNKVKPTCSATPGDISLVLPHRILTNIIETLYALDRVAPGCSNDDTLLYGVEAKYYSLQPYHTSDFEIEKNLYLIGDGSGVTRGLAQAGAMGLYVADKLLEKSKR